MIGWGLFDSGNGSYAKVAKEMGIEFYSIGLDITNKNDHFINFDLADYSYLFGNNMMIDTLKELPQPDFIMASPPCESWSVASAMRGATQVGSKNKGMHCLSLKYHCRDLRLEAIKITNRRKCNLNMIARLSIG